MQVKFDNIASMASNQSASVLYTKQDDCHESLKEVLDNSTVTKEIAEILAPLEKDILALS